MSMTSPRSSYSGGYYAASSYPETPIYDMLVAERGTPQIAPIRVPSAYDTGSTGGALAALPPALPSGHEPQPPQPAPLHHTPAPSYGYQGAAAPQPQMPQPAPQQAAPAPMRQQPVRQAPAALPPGGGGGQSGPVPLQHTPAPHIPQQAPPRGYGYPGPGGPAQPQAPMQQQPPPQPQVQVQVQQYQQQSVHNQATQYMRPVAPRPAAPRPMPGQHEDPYGGHQYGRGY